jgi:histidinol-phosphatase
VGGLSDDLSLALALADIADAITLARYRAEDLEIETKPDLTPVTEADRAVERAVRERLGEVMPADSVLGEEYGASAPSGDRGEAAGGDARRWIIDPIDGTKNYVRGIPVWATLLSLQDSSEIVVGVVSAPALRRRWWAARGLGAFVDDGLAGGPRRIRVSAVRGLADAQLCFPGLDDWDDHGGLDRLLDLARRCWRSRGFGDFWSYMLVAEGAADISCEPVVSLWDLAAPQVIVEEAGGRFTDLRGSRTADGGDAIATNGHLHEAALAIVGG